MKKPTNADKHQPQTLLFVFMTSALMQFLLLTTFAQAQTSSHPQTLRLPPPSGTGIGNGGGGSQDQLIARITSRVQLMSELSLQSLNSRTTSRWCQELFPIFDMAISYANAQETRLKHAEAENILLTTLRLTYVSSIAQNPQAPLTLRLISRTLDAYNQYVPLSGEPRISLETRVHFLMRMTQLIRRAAAEIDPHGFIEALQPTTVPAHADLLTRQTQALVHGITLQMRALRGAIFLAPSAPTSLTTATSVTPVGGVVDFPFIAAQVFLRGVADDLEQVLTQPRFTADPNHAHHLCLAQSIRNYSHEIGFLLSDQLSVFSSHRQAIQDLAAHLEQWTDPLQSRCEQP